MRHENFPIRGYEFMNECATDEQKGIIIGLCKQLDSRFNGNGPWPNPFSKWDAKRMIDVLMNELGLPIKE